MRKDTGRFGMPTDGTERLIVAVQDMVQNPWMVSFPDRRRAIEAYNAQRGYWLREMSTAEREVFEVLVPRW